jgi:hypothetical protein
MNSIRNHFAFDRVADKNIIDNSSGNLSCGVLNISQVEHRQVSSKQPGTGKWSSTTGCNSLSNGKGLKDQITNGGNGKWKRIITGLGGADRGAMRKADFLFFKTFQFAVTIWKV